MQEASKLELVRNSALASELTGDQCRVLADAMHAHDLADRDILVEREKLESLLDRDPVIVYRVMRAIFRVVHVILNRLAMQSSELTNYVFKVHGKY